MVPEKHSHCTIERSSPSKRNEFSTSSEISSLLLQEGKKGVDETVLKEGVKKRNLKQRKNYLISRAGLSLICFCSLLGVSFESPLIECFE